ncbi:MAG: hypothetical protein LBU25_05845 [Treponema sp.]|jgi:hypothetical protein|nr:hypothetical protein [Treponema sp.]
MDKTPEPPGAGEGKPDPLSPRFILDEARGVLVLEFDTGLDAQAFAQLKLAHLITESGLTVSPDGSWTPWKPQGIREQHGTMGIWGPAFTGERLDILITDDTRKDEALDALRYWIRACLCLEARQRLPVPWPAGAILGPEGTILFPPEKLLRYSLNAAGPEPWFTGVEQYVHPDLSGIAGTAFTAGAMLYRLFCGSPPFPNPNLELLYKDMREGVFLPLTLAAPGLDTDLAALISRTLSPCKEKHAATASLILNALEGLLGPPGSAAAASYLHEMDPAEQARLTREKARFIQQRTRRVQARRFMHRNIPLIGGISIALLSLVLIITSVISDRAKRPNTQGMEPKEVVETYYHAMGILDHLQMDACVMPKTGRDDIGMVTNFFVITRVRQAYERTIPAVLSAQEWIDAGSPPTEATVFGVSDLRLEGIDQDERDGEVSFAASYLLWLPGSFRDPADPGQRETGSETAEEAGFPRSISRRDLIRLIYYRGAWRIAEIQRKP